MSSFPEDVGRLYTRSTPQRLSSVAGQQRYYKQLAASSR